MPVTAQKPLQQDISALFGRSRTEGHNDVERIYSEIRDDLKQANTRAALTELYRRAGYLVTQTDAPGWEKRYGERAPALREQARSEFRHLVREINARAGRLGIKGEFAEAWGKMKTSI
jgi:hypothetical protein